MTTFNTGWLTPATAYNVSSKAPVGGALAGQQVWANTPGILGRVASLPTNAAVSAAMSAAGTGTSATGWLVAQQFRVTPSVKGQVALWQIPNYTLSLPASISALGFELVYGRVVTSTTQFEVKTCGLSLVSGKPGGGTATSGFVGTDQGNATGWTTTSSQTTVGGPTNLLGLAAAYASAGFINSQDMGFALWARVSGTGGATLNPSVGTYQLRFYYDLPKATEPGPPEFGWKLNAPNQRNTTNTGWIVATSAIMVSANISGANAAESLSNATGSADAAFTSGTFNNDGSFDHLFLFFDIQRPGKTVVVSGVEVVVYAKSLSGNVSAKYQFASAASRGMYPSYDFTNLGAGAAVSAEVPLTTVSAALTAGSPTQTWGEGMTATRAFVSADAGQAGKVGFMFMQHAAGDHNNYAVDGARMKITYSLVGIGEQNPVGLQLIRTTDVKTTPEFGYESQGDTATSAKTSPFIYPTSAINVSSDNGLGSLWTTRQNAFGSADGNYTSAVGASAAGTDWLVNFYNFRELHLPNNAVVSGATVFAAGFGGGVNNLANFQFVSAKTFTNLPSGVDFIGASGQVSFGATGVCAVATTGGATFNWGGAVTAARFTSTNSPPLGLAFAFAGNNLGNADIDTVSFQLSYSYTPGQDVGIQNNIVPIQSDYGFEAKSTFAGKVFNPTKSQYGYESTSFFTTNNIMAIQSDYGFELASVQVVSQAVPARNTYGFESSSALITDTFPARSTYGYESTSDALETNFNAQSAEFGYEQSSVQISPVIQAIQSDYGVEAGSVAMVQAVPVAPSRSTYGYESTSDQILINFVVQSAEFGFEVQQAPMTQNNVIGANTSNSKYGFESGSPAIRNNIVVQSSKFGYESSSVGLGVNIQAQSSEYGYESSVVSLKEIIDVLSGEFGYESSDAHIQLQTFMTMGDAPSEYGYESRSVQLIQAVNMNPLASEFGFEANSIMMRVFRLNTAITNDRIKRVRQL